MYNGTRKEVMKTDRKMLRLYTECDTAQAGKVDAVVEPNASVGRTQRTEPRICIERAKLHHYRIQH